MPMHCLSSAEGLHPAISLLMSSSKGWLTLNQMKHHLLTGETETLPALCFFTGLQLALPLVIIRTARHGQIQPPTGCTSVQSGFFWKHFHNKVFSEFEVHFDIRKPLKCSICWCIACTARHGQFSYVQGPHIISQWHLYFWFLDFVW